MSQIVAKEHTCAVLNNEKNQNVYWYRAPSTSTAVARRTGPERTWNSSNRRGKRVCIANQIEQRVQKFYEVLFRLTSPKLVIPKQDSAPS